MLSTVGLPTTNWPMPAALPAASVPISVCGVPFCQVTFVSSMFASLAYVGKRLRTTEPGVSASVLPSGPSAW